MNYFLAMWISLYGKNTYKTLSDKMKENRKMFDNLGNSKISDEWMKNYFLTTYATIMLRKFGLDFEQLSMCLDLIIAPGITCIFDPKEVFDDQKSLIAEIEGNVNDYLKKFHT